MLLDLDPVPVHSFSKFGFGSDLLLGLFGFSYVTSLFSFQMRFQMDTICTDELSTNISEVPYLKDKTELMNFIE